MTKAVSPLMACFFVWIPALRAADDPTPVVVGSKAFTESVILSELVAQLAGRAGNPVTHKAELGGTRVLWNALRQGQIDVYPEYTGTIRQEIFSGRNVESLKSLEQALADQGIRMSRPLGFNNTYALGMKEEVAARLGIRTISDLRQHPDLKIGFSNEFMERGDGWPALRERYQLPQKNVAGLDHILAYTGLNNGSIDITDLYSTDPEIRYYGLRLLQDDLGVFPRYHAVLLYRADLETRAPHAVSEFLQLEGRVPTSAIVEMNAQAKPKSGQRVPEQQIAADFLSENPFFSSAGESENQTATLARATDETTARRLWKRTGEHLFLVAVSLAAAIVIAVPLGILAARHPRLGQFILAVTGIVQTIPSLALLVLIMALLYILPPLPLIHKVPTLGTLPAIIALFLYSLLPIVRNTYAGLHDIPITIRESAEALGLPVAARLRLIELPMAARSILAGIKTSAVINVGTATLGALIGAGGYGQPILTGIRLDDIGLILEGAIPAAVLALLMQWLFDGVELFIVPKGLRLEPSG